MRHSVSHVNMFEQKARMLLVCVISVSIVDLFVQVIAVGWGY